MEFPRVHSQGEHPRNSIRRITFYYKILMKRRRENPKSFQDSYHFHFIRILHSHILGEHEPHTAFAILEHPTYAYFGFPSSCSIYIKLPKTIRRTKYRYPLLRRSIDQNCLPVMINVVKFQVLVSYNSPLGHFQLHLIKEILKRALSL